MGTNTHQMDHKYHKYFQIRTVTDRTNTDIYLWTNILENFSKQMSFPGIFSLFFTTFVPKFWVHGPRPKHNKYQQIRIYPSQKSHGYGYSADTANPGIFEYEYTDISVSVSGAARNRAAVYAVQWLMRSGCPFMNHGSSPLVTQAQHCTAT